MKTAEAVFVLHGDVNRRSNILQIIDDDAYVVVWPDTSYEDAIKNMRGFNPEKHKVLNIGSKEKLYIGRNNIIDWCHKNGITRFWMLDDDISSFRVAGPSQEYKDKVSTNRIVHIRNLEFDDDIGLGGMANGGAMFYGAIKQPMYGKRFVWAAIFIDLSLNDVKYSVEGYDDIDMQLECIMRDIKFQTHNYIGHHKPKWLKKKSLNSSTDKINYNNYMVYKKWGDKVQIDVYYDDDKNKYFRAHLKYPYTKEDLGSPRFKTESLEEFVQSLEEAYRDHPETFKVCGLPHLRNVNKAH